MNNFSLLLVFAALISLTTAYCPNGCNGQGTCGVNDKCTCYMRGDVTTESAYIGGDCSQRTCPTGSPWSATPTATNVARATNVECSNQGLCDRASGICTCFPGYGGKSCERTLCPNDCNRRGVCLTLKQIAKDAATASKTYTAWDATKHMGCVCDSGFRGPDCSLMECPSDADVLLGYGKTEGRECGGRGLCNRETGNCQCFPGYYGTACTKQSTVQ